MAKYTLDDVERKLDRLESQAPDRLAKLRARLHDYQARHRNDAESASRGVELGSSTFPLKLARTAGRATTPESPSERELHDKIDSLYQVGIRQQELRSLLRAMSAPGWRLELSHDLDALGEWADKVLTPTNEGL